MGSSSRQLAMPALLNAAVVALHGADAAADEGISTSIPSVTQPLQAAADIPVSSGIKSTAPIEVQPTPFSAMALASLSDAQPEQLPVGSAAPAVGVGASTNLSGVSLAKSTVTDSGAAPAVGPAGSLQASRSMSESVVQTGIPGDAQHAWAVAAKRSATLSRPMDAAQAVAAASTELAARTRLALERNAQILHSLQQQGGGKAIQDVALTASLTKNTSSVSTQRGNSMQSSMDAFMPEALQMDALRSESADALTVSQPLPASQPSSSSSRPPPVPPRLGRVQELSEEPYEDAVRVWLDSQDHPQIALPAGQQRLPSESSAAAGGAAAPGSGKSTVQKAAALVTDAEAQPQLSEESAEAMHACLTVSVADTAVAVAPPPKAEAQMLGAALPEGLRSALGLSTGDPVGKLLQPGSQADLLRTALVPTAGMMHSQADTVTVAAAIMPASAWVQPTPPPKPEAAAANVATAGPEAGAQAPVVAAAAAVQQHQVFAPLAHSAAQMGTTFVPGAAAAAAASMASSRAAAAAAVAAAAAGGLMQSGFQASPVGTAADLNMHPLSLQLYQAFLSNFAAGVIPGQLPSAMPPLSSAGMDPSGSFGGTPAADGGAAAMAQLLAFRSELFAVHLCVKLFHCTPSDLPEDAREQLTGWLKSAPACTELYVRTGCVHLTLTVWCKLACSFLLLLICASFSLEIHAPLADTGRRCAYVHCRAWPAPCSVDSTAGSLLAWCFGSFQQHEVACNAGFMLY